MELNKDNRDVYIVKLENGNNLTSYISADKKTGNIIQTVKINSNQKLFVSVNNRDNNNIKGVFNNQEIIFNKDGVVITSPKSKGVYVMTIPNTNTILHVEVMQDTEIEDVVTTTKKRSVWSWVKGLFGFR